MFKNLRAILAFLPEALGTTVAFAAIEWGLQQLRDTRDQQAAVILELDEQITERRRMLGQLEQELKGQPDVAQ